MEERRRGRIEEQIRMEVSEIIEREIQDPRIGLVTITGVRLASDLSHAHIFISSLGGDDVHKKTLEGLRSANPFVRRSLSRRLAHLRRIPDLTFEYDESIARGERIDALLDQIKTEPKS